MAWQQLSSSNLTWEGFTKETTRASLLMQFNSEQSILWMAIKIRFCNSSKLVPLVHQQTMVNHKSQDKIKKILDWKQLNRQHLLVSIPWSLCSLCAKQTETVLQTWPFSTSLIRRSAKLQLQLEPRIRWPIQISSTTLLGNLEFSSTNYRETTSIMLQGKLLTITRSHHLY